MRIDELGIKDYGRAIMKKVKGDLPAAMDVVKMYQQSYPEASKEQIKDMSLKHIKALKDKQAKGQSQSGNSGKSLTPQQVADELEKESGKTIEPEKAGDSRFKTPPMGSVIRFNKSLNMKPIRWDGRQWTSMDGVEKRSDPGSQAEKHYHEIYFQGKAEGLFQ